MAHLKLNSFTSWHLDSQEMEQGSMLTVTQKQVIQTRLADIAEEKLALTLDPNNTLAYIQAESNLAGQLAALNWLLDISAAYEQQTRDGATILENEQ